MDYRWQTTVLVVALGFSGMLLADKGGDWRSHGSSEDKIAQILDTLPSTSHVMVEVGERYQNLYWAAKLDQWEFAEYQAEEIVGLIELLQISRPERAATAQRFLDHAMDEFEVAFEKKDWAAFQHAFHTLRAQCIVCHDHNGHGFIVPPEQPATATSVILNLPQR